MDALFFALPLVILCGILSSWYDVKHGSVPNALVFLFGALGTIIQVSFFFVSWERGTTSPAAIIMAIINIIIATGVAYILWKKQWWYGGDAKLFIAYILLMPISAFHFVSHAFFPAVAMLINTFIPFSLFSLISHVKKKSFSLPSVVHSVISVFSLSWISYFLQPAPAFFVMIAGFSLLQFFSFPPMALYAIFLLRTILDPSVWTISFLKGFVFWTVLLVGAKQYILAHAEFFVHRAAPKQGDIIAEEITLYGKSIPEGAVLTKIQAQSIRSPILIHDTIPFAPCLFFGALLSMLTNGAFSFISFI